MKTDCCQIESRGSQLGADVEADMLLSSRQMRRAVCGSWSVSVSVADSCWVLVSDLFLSGSGFRVWMWTLWLLSTSRWTRPPRWGGARTVPTDASTPTWAPPATSRWSWPRRSRSSPNQRRRWLRRRRWGGAGGGGGRGGWRCIRSNHTVGLLQLVMLHWWPLRTPLDEPWKQTVNSEQLTCWRAAVSPVDDVTNCCLFCRFHRRSSRSRSWWPGSKSIKLNMFITIRLAASLFSWCSVIVCSCLRTFIHTHVQDRKQVQV